jgi:predicted short-subunit dehydrogenase-like oxidoreductase (DUF2520 family)
VKSVFIFGAGKVGRALARALRAAGRPAIAVTLHPARKGLPKRKIESDLLVLAVRDRDLAPLARDLADRGLVSKRTACVHVAGAQTAEAIAALREVSAGVAQMHPMISFASTRFFPTLEGGHVHVKGDPVAEKRARALAKRIGMTPRTFASLDTVGYHAAAGLVANGAAALAAVGVELLARSGVPADVAPAILGPLLRSVAENVLALGFPEALTGPVRRGDTAAVVRHFAVVRERLPSAFPLYLASVGAQIPLARGIGEAAPSSLDAIGAFVARAQGELLVKNSGNEEVGRDAKERGF